MVLHTALMDEPAHSMAQILDHSMQQHQQQQQRPHLQEVSAQQIQHQRQAQPQQPSVAVFYSISSTQRGLSGVDLGQMLIKRVADLVKVGLHAPHAGAHQSSLSHQSRIPQTKSEKWTSSVGCATISNRSCTCWYQYGLSNLRKNTYIRAVS